MRILTGSLRVTPSILSVWSELKRNRIRSFPFISRHEVNVSLRHSSIHMVHECGNLIPHLPLSNQDRNERVSQYVISVQSFKVRTPDNLLEESIRLVTPSLLNRAFALVFPPFVAPYVFEFFEDRKQDATSLGPLRDVLKARIDP